MLTYFKAFVVLFVLAGAAFVFYGGWKAYRAMREENAPASSRQRRGHYVFSVRYLAILAVGLGFIIIPLLIWNVGSRALDTPAGVEFTADLEEYFTEILAWKVGPVSVLHMLLATVGLAAVVILLSIIQKLFKR